MTQYSIQHREIRFVKGFGFLSFAKNMDKNIGKNINKTLSGRYSQNLLDHAKQSATDALKTISKRVLRKTAEVTGDLIGNKIAETVAKSYNCKITKVSKNSPQNRFEIYIYRTKTENYWWSKINIIV